MQHLSPKLGAPRRLATLALAAIALSLISVSARAIDVTAWINGVPTSIGTITPTLSNAPPPPNMQATFQANATGLPYMNTNCGWQFRWIQIISAVSDGVDLNNDAFKYQSAPGSGYDTTPTAPFVDQPPGGYKYQAPNGGADNDPFYDNSGSGYAIPNFQDETNSGAGTYHIYDAPNIVPVSNPGDTVTFKTYLTFVCPTMPDMVQVLAGYSWMVTHQADGSNMLSFVPPPDGAIGPDPENTGIPAADLAELQTALDNTGFEDWTVSTGLDDTLCQTCVPEFSTVFMLISGSGGLLLQVRRGRRSARQIAA